MKQLLFAAIALPAVLLAGERRDLMTAAAPYFRIGTAIGPNVFSSEGRDEAACEALLATFNALEPENALKPGPVLKAKGEYDFTDADRYVAFGEEHGMEVYGHCLVWYMQTPSWMHSHEDGTPLPREEAIENLRNHIQTMIGRYKGRIRGWDVVNEAWMEDGSMRDCGWRRAIGDDYIELAFRFAHEADPDCELYYNDYAMAERAKCDAIIAMVKDLRAKGLRVDAVGFQTHVSLWYPSVSDYAKSMDDMIAAGIRLNVTEMDVGVLPDPVGDDLKNLYPPEGLPDDVQNRLTDRYRLFFTEFLKRHEWIDRVSLWGVTDRQSWLNYFPRNGRVNHPLLYDRAANPKPVLGELIRLVSGWASHGEGLRVAEMPRITSLELFGERSPAAFSEKAVKYAADAGYNAVFVNGGCGFGSEAMPPESLLITEAIPDLMPHTAERNIREVKERIKRLSKYGMKPWICWWTGVGTDDKANQTEAPNIRCRRELYAKYRKSPEMFGTGPYWRWRGNRPICISHPKVREFYTELFERLPKEYPELDGVFFFPGDAELENCTDDCPNCAATGLGRFDRMARFANEVYAAWVKGGGNPEHFYYAFWNLDQPNGGGEILSSTMANTIAMLAPGMGLAMTICDNTVEKRVTGDIILNQPWSTCNKIGSLFKAMIESEQAKGRPVMVVSEISQSELFDPVCANMPFTLSTLELFRNCLKIPNCNAIVDFWGNRPPYEIPDACHEVMKEFMKDEIAGALKSDDEILLAAAGRHYGDAALAEKGLAAWKAFDKLCREFPLCGWGQRISFAVGRTGARGPLYLPLVPPALKLGDYSWAWHLLLQNNMNPLDCYRFQKEAMPMYEECAAAFDAIGTDLARDEALRVRLFGKMNLSIGAFVAAQALHRDQRFDELRTVVEEELKNRVDELMMSFDLMPGSGVNNIAVEEDIGNMSLYLSDPEFPNSPDSLFNFQPAFGHTYTF